MLMICKTGESFAVAVKSMYLRDVFMTKDRRTWVVVHITSMSVLS